MSSRTIASDHPDLDEIVKVSVDDQGQYRIAVQVSADAMEKNREETGRTAHDLGAKYEIERVNEYAHNIIFSELDKDTAREVADFIAHAFVTYDESMQAALREINLDA